MLISPLAGGKVASVMVGECYDLNSFTLEL